MNDQLQKLIADTEKELAELDAQYAPLRTEFDAVTEAVNPQLDRLHVLEQQMDDLKPRKFELEHHLEHLREINPDFELHKRSKDVDIEDLDMQEEAGQTPPATPPPT